MKKENLKKICPGFYVDWNRSLYFDVREFLKANRLQDTPEVRNAVWQQVRQDFGVIGIAELTDE